MRKAVRSWLSTWALGRAALSLRRHILSRLRPAAPRELLHDWRQGSALRRLERRIARGGSAP